MADLDAVQLGRDAGADWYAGQRRLMMRQETTGIRRTLAAVGIELVAAPAASAAY
ncbi:hypothetical protein H7J88_09680 [Mycolicibacterium flavescens]|uniref:hypothetical protein n=1 Tax=Mycolicibacterium flavescens TaxID=1776 RepID=UPI0013F4D400|nr:hypothetical protein [Mycolicibacterium flavescens]MCV7279918.1 hypothetical protein [Mycolicibacterium flavescens]